MLVGGGGGGGGATDNTSGSTPDVPYHGAGGGGALSVSLVQYIPPGGTGTHTTGVGNNGLTASICICLEDYTVEIGNGGNAGGGGDVIEGSFDTVDTTPKRRNPWKCYLDRSHSLNLQLIKRRNIGG